MKRGKATQWVEDTMYDNLLKANRAKGAYNRRSKDREGKRCVSIIELPDAGAA